MSLETKLAKASRAATAVIEPKVKAAKPKPEPKSKPEPKVEPKVETKAEKKTTKKAEKSERRAAYPDDATVKVLKTEHTYSGKRGKAIDALLKDGQTIEAYKEHLVKLSLASYHGAAITRAIDLKLIALKGK